MSHFSHFFSISNHCKHIKTYHIKTLLITIKSAKKESAGTANVEKDTKIPADTSTKMEYANSQDVPMLPRNLYRKMK